MDFKECIEASQAWCLESGTSFRVDFFDEDENKIYFKFQGGDEEESNTDIMFNITVPIKNDLNSKWVYL